MSSRRRAYLSMLRRRVLELLARGYDVYVRSVYRGVVGGELLPAVACQFAPVLSRSVVGLYARYLVKLGKCGSEPPYYVVDGLTISTDAPALRVVEELPQPSPRIAVVELSSQTALELQERGYKVYYLSLG